jgi:hypothetical protein
LDGGFTLPVGQDRVVGHDPGTSRQHEDNLDIFDRPIAGIGDRYDNRLVQCLADGAGLTAAVKHYDFGGFSRAGKEDVGATTAGQSQLHPE